METKRKLYSIYKTSLKVDYGPITEGIILAIVKGESKNVVCNNMGPLARHYCKSLRKSMRMVIIRLKHHPLEILFFIFRNRKYKTIVK